ERGLPATIPQQSARALSAAPARCRPMRKSRSCVGCAWMALSWTLGTAACEPFDVVLATQGGSEIDPEPDSGTGLPSPDGAACPPPRAAVVADGDVAGSVCTRAFAAQVFQ